MPNLLNLRQQMEVKYAKTQDFGEFNSVQAKRERYLRGHYKNGAGFRGFTLRK